jgi:prepilin signal peptidase PulO-like enzyme (type II secretory pathway)
MLYFYPSWVYNDFDYQFGDYVMFIIYILFLGWIINVWISSLIREEIINSRSMCCECDDDSDDSEDYGYIPW